MPHLVEWVTAVTSAQLITAALRELQANPPDPRQANVYIHEIPAAALDDVAADLVQLVGMAAGRQASLRLKAVAR